jgi:NAD(P)H-hydrate repair Nnr-like enzyme with NAD(P)H-hydrate dehydratase domain
MNPPQFTTQSDAPLFPNVLYNRPVTRHAAGRMLLVGGHTSEFSLPTAINQLAVAAGVGECNVVLPDTLASLLSGAPGTRFAAANPSGSFSREALGRILELSEDADAVAIGASLSNNSDTAMLIERLITEVARPLIIFGDALTATQHSPNIVTDNPDTLTILTMTEVFKLAGRLSIPIQIRRGAGLINKLEIIQDIKAATRCQFVVYGSEIIVAADTALIVTPISYRLSLVPALFYAVLGTFWLQNRTNRRAGLATGSWLIHELSLGLEPTGQPSTSQLAAELDTILRRDEF